MAASFVRFDLHASPVMLINYARSLKLSAIVRRAREHDSVSQSSEAQYSAARRTAAVTVPCRW